MRLERLGNGERTDLPEDLMEAANAFLDAGRRYREFLKRHHKDRLRGTVFALDVDGEMVLYTESDRQAAAVKNAMLPDI